MTEVDGIVSQGDDLDWSMANPAVDNDAGAVTIVMPVYGAITETLACIHSVLTSKRVAPAHLVVIDDCSPGEDDFSTLRAMSDDGRLFSVLRNDTNKGFVHTVNRGLLAALDDVVLLNSDTLVTDGWLDRLVAHARQDEAIASVSPMTNNATILSYPRINGANALPTDTTLGELASFFAMNGALPVVEAPVTVGFCMLLTRAAIQAVGGFDEGLFGIGYGEECDWCMRATSLGYRHVIAVDAFVYHVGSASFSAKAARRQDLAARALAMRHPQYWHLIGQFCAADPLTTARRAVDVRRIIRGAAGLKGVVLQILHGLGGGTQVHAVHLAMLLAEEGYGSIFLKPDGMGRLTATADFVDDLPNLTFDCATDLTLLRDMIAGVGVVRRHIHALIGFSPQATAFLSAIAVETTITLHDYVPICPQITLLDHTGSFCDLPSHMRCNTCVKLKPPPISCDDIATWRREWLAILDAGDRVLAPSDYVKHLFQRVFPTLEIEVVPHSLGMPRALPLGSMRYKPSIDEAPSRQTVVSRPRRVAVLGNLNHHKGIDIVVACAALARDDNQQLEFLVFGNMDVDASQLGGKLRKMGAYQRANLRTILATHRCDIGFLPSIWPETYSYVLSEILELGLHPVVFDLGAQAVRLRAAGVGTILPVGLNPSSINARLLGLTLDESRAREDADPQAASARASTDYLERVYGSGWSRRQDVGYHQMRWRPSETIATISGQSADGHRT